MRLHLIAATAVVAIATAGCSGGTGGASRGGVPTSRSGGSATTVRIGFIGPQSSLSAEVKDGMQLAISQYDAINLSERVELDAVTVGGSASESTAAATRLVNDKVVAVVGPVLSDEASAADPVFERMGIPSVDPTAPDASLSQHGWKYFHRLIANENVQAAGDVDYMLKTLGLSKVAVMNDSTADQQNLAQAVGADVTSDGATVVLTGLVDSPQHADPTVVAEVMGTKPDVVFVAADAQTAGRLLGELRVAGYTGRFMAGEEANDAGFVVAANGAPAEGAYLSCGCMGTANSQSAQSFNASFLAQFGSTPGPYSAEGYDAAETVLQAVKAGATSPSQINTYLGTIDFQGITKTIKFQSDGEIAGASAYIYKVEDGQIVQVGSSS